MNRSIISSPSLSARRPPNAGIPSFVAADTIAGHIEGFVEGNEVKRTALARLVERPRVKLLTEHSSVRQRAA